jgi:putative Ca2+/H+ antiporter (TMEM165/GDT1 family)
MDALLPPLVAAFLAEWGDKTQLLAVMLAIQFRRTNAVLLGIAAAAMLNSLAAAFVGSLITGVITFRALTLMTALALVFAGIGALLPQKPPKLHSQGAGGVMFASFFAFGVLEFGDKTQFMTTTLAARADSIWLAAIGATVGIMAATVPGVVMAERFSSALPVRAFRLTSGVILLSAGVFVALGALRLF